MSSVDDRIVNMQFNNAQFEQNMKTSMNSLEGLKKGLNLDAAAKGIGSLQAAGDKFNLSSMAQGVDNISSRFSALGVIGFTVIQKLADAGIGFAREMAGFVFDPLVEGGKRRALNIEQAKFQFKGLKMDIVKAMADSLYAVKGTAYGLDAAAKAASQLGASGVKLGDDMRSSLRAISGVAAMTNSSYDDIAQVFTTVAGNGRLMSNELNRLSARGINAAAIIAKSMGTTEAKVRAMVTDGKISFKEFSKAMDGAFGKHAKAASQTYEGALKNIGAAFSRIGASFATADFEKQRKIFNALNPVIDSIHESLAPLITVFEEFSKSSAKSMVGLLGSLSVGPWSDFGRAVYTVSNGLKILLGVVDVVGNVAKEAFAQIFPSEVTQYPKILERMALGFNQVVLAIKMVVGDGSKLKSTFAGIFAIFSIAGQILSRVITMFANLFSSTDKGSGSILDFTGAIGDWLVSVDEALKKGEGLNNFFSGLTGILAVPIALISTIADFVSKLASGIQGLDFKSFIDDIQKKLEPLQKTGDGVTTTFGKIVNALAKVWEFFQPLATAIANGLGTLGDKIREAVAGMSIGNLQNVAGVGILAMIGQLVARFILTFGQAVKNTLGMGTTIKIILTTLNTNLQIMQASLKADILLKIAAAIALLALSVMMLSTVDPSRLATALGGIGALLTGLMVTLAAFEKLSSAADVIKITAISAALILLSIAIAILSTSVKSLASLSWEELTKGLIGVGGLLAGLALFTKFAQVNKGAIGQATGLILLGIAIKILASAVKDFASMSWEDLAKGAMAVSGLLVGIAGAMKLMPKSIFIIGPGLMVVAASMVVLAAALKIFAGMSWEEMAKGGVALAGSLVIIAGAMNLMPKNMGLTAAGLILVGIALNIIGMAIKTMGSMGWEEIAKGLVTLIGSLVLIAAGMSMMTGALPGAAALIIVSAALAILAPVLLAFGAMSWEAIAKGLTMLAATFLIIGLAGLALTPVIPSLIGLGIAIALLGAGVALAGVGLLAFSAGLLALSVAGAAGTVAMVALVSALVGMIPMILTQVGLGIVGIMNVVAQSGASFIGATVTLLSSLLTAIVIVTPMAIDAVIVMITKLLDALEKNTEKFVVSGMKIMTGLLRGIANHIAEVVAEGLHVVSQFIKGVAKGLPGVVEEAANLIIAFINSIAATIRNKSSELGRAGGNLASALVEGMLKGLISGVASIGEAAARLANAAIDEIKRVLNIHSPSKVMEQLGKYAGEGFYRGLLGMEAPVVDRVTETINAMKTAIKEAITTADSDIKRLTAKLKKQNKDKKKSKKDKAAIAQTKKELSEAKKTKEAAKKTEIYLSKNMKSEQARLVKLSSQYDIITDKIISAAQALQDAQQKQADAEKAFSQQYSSLPEFANDGDLVNQYLDSMKTQIEATKEFADDLAVLRKAGLDDATYQKLLDKGLSAQPFIDALIESGQVGIDEINKLDKALNGAAGDLGSTASKELYQAGVDAAKGLLNGLIAESDAISAEMEKIAKKMVDSIKKALGIKSPSKEFAKVGGYSVNGLIQGMQKMLPSVEKNSENIGNTALDAIQNSMRAVSAELANDLNMSPTIRPVLDLTDIKNKSSDLDNMLNGKTIGVGTSYNRAAAISLANKESQNDIDTQQKTTPETSAKALFVQNNYSPKALSYSEIYRQTQNQISKIKTGLPK